MTAVSLVSHAARFARALRERGVRVSLSDEVDAVAALALVDVSDRDEVRRALAAALKIRPRDAAAFHELFDAFWSSGEAPGTVGADERRSPDRAVPGRRIRGSRARKPSTEVVERETLEGDSPGYSPEALLRNKSLEECTAEELARMERFLPRLAERLAVRRSRRLVAARGRGRIDPRRSFREAVRTDGEFLRLARRRRAIEIPRITVLCDTSGSMDPHAAFVLSFLLGLKKVARRTEIFAFNTALVRLTPWISPGKLGATLARLSAAVPDWSGGTRIGESLADFVRRYLDESVDGKTTVVIVSDGLDRGDTEALAHAMRAIRSRARRVIWLNPLLADPRYEPTARGMEAALPFVDVLAPAHNLASLERVIPMLAA